MKATELRIGNLVLHNDFIDKISEIGQCNNGFTEIEGYFNFDKGSVGPIPLTEEWLLKLGFVKVKDEFQDNFVLNNDCSITHEKKGSEQGFWYSNDKSDAYCFRLKEINFVHQLQNLHHALTGEELILK